MQQHRKRLLCLRMRETTKVKLCIQSVLHTEMTTQSNETDQHCHSKVMLKTMLFERTEGPIALQLLDAELQRQSFKDCTYLEPSMERSSFVDKQLLASVEMYMLSRTKKYLLLKAVLLETNEKTLKNFVENNNRSCSRRRRRELHLVSNRSRI